MVIMEMEPQSYNSTNLMQVKEARRLMDTIVDDNGNLPKLDIILDIGCGSGNVTQILAQTIPHDLIIGFDINSNLIDFALSANKSKTTEYLVEDITKPWDELHPRIKSLEGKVNLVFSNMVFHWIKETDPTCQNIQRLLKPDGIIHINAALMNQITNVLPKSSKKAMDKILPIGSHKDQLLKWTAAFTSAGVENIETIVLQNHVTFNTPEGFGAFLSIFQQWYLGHVDPAYLLKHPEVKEEIDQLAFQTYFITTGEKFKGYVFEGECSVHYDHYLLKARKPAKLSKVDTDTEVQVIPERSGIVEKFCFMQ